jgi:cytidylate kinase
MIYKSSSQQLAEALVHAGTYGRERLEARIGEGPFFTIALSREAGAGGTSVAREVGARLGWPVYDHELVERIAKEMKLRTQLLESVDERRRGWVQDAVESFLASIPSVSETAYVRRLVETVLSLGTHGECVLVGRGAVLLLPPAITLRVRLVAALEDRITVMSRDRGLSREDAARYVERTDRERRRFIQDHFGKDPTDAQHYDLVLNYSRFTAAECADFIVEALRRLEAHARRGPSANR